MKKLVLIFVLSATCFGLKAQHEGHDHAAPASNTSKSNVAENVAAIDTSLFLPENIFDFGKIPQGKPVTHQFVVSNHGKTALKIENVQASCGCTTPEWEKDKVLSPGESTQIKVGYNAAAEGPFNKTITITYEQGQMKQMNIKGEVWKTPASSAPGNAAIESLKEK
jgi:hypothetical protein